MLPFWRSLWSDWRASFWFVPTVLVLGAVAGAVGLIEVDVRFDTRVIQLWPRFFGVGADGARGTLTAIATAMMTVAGVVFSITVVALSLASSQYSPRVLRNFIRDRPTQIVLGVFVGVFAYCLVVLRTIRGADEGPFVPPLATIGGVLLAFTGIGFLIYFIHHIALAIQASHILATAAAETLHAVDDVFPEDLGVGEDDAQAEGDAPLAAGDAWHVVPAQRTGYLQRLDTDTLLTVACTHELVVRMECGIGAFLIEGLPLATVAGPSPPDARAVCELQEAYTVNRQRSVEQDVAFGMQQIVDVALKALSPGINDTTTAVMSVDYLTAILTRLARRRFPAPWRYAAGTLRVLACGPTFPALLALAWDPIRRNAAGNVTVLAHLLGALEILAGQTASPTRRRALLQQVRHVDEVVQRSIEAPADRQALTLQSLRVIRRLEPGHRP